MSERTPSTSTIRHAWAKAHPFPLTTDVEERYAEFDRWLAAHDAAKRAEWEAAQGEVEEPSEPAEEPVLCNASRYIGGVFYMCDIVGDHDIHVDEAAGVSWRAR